MAIAEFNPDRAGEVAALVAQHYEHADLTFEACTWYLNGASWAMTNDQTGAVEHLTRVTMLDHDLPDSPESDRLRATTRVLLLSIGWRVGSDLRHCENSATKASRPPSERESRGLQEASWAATPATRSAGTRRPGRLGSTTVDEFLISTGADR